MIVRSILTVAALVTLTTAAATAAPKGGVGNTESGRRDWVQSDNANVNACFGQARGNWASTLGQGTNEYYPEGTSNGDVLSQLAQDGTMHEDNEQFIADYCE